MLPFLLIGAGLACSVGALLLRPKPPVVVGGSATGGADRDQERAGGGDGQPKLGLLSRNRWARRAVGACAVLLLLGATVAAAYPFLTDRYTETLQQRLRKELVAGETREAFVNRRVEVGTSLTRLQIPSIGVDTVVVEGTTDDALRAGAGHYPETPLPCDDGNVAIAGHRVTFGKPFNRLAEVKVGDTVTLETPVGSCTYRVTTAPFPVDPADVSVANPQADTPMLTLTTCHPEGSARQRLVLKAERVAVHEETR